jgi:alpha-glucosidase (family GH31 glycosyl hydrolase)
MKTLIIGLVAAGASAMSEGVPRAAEAQRAESSVGAPIPRLKFTSGQNYLLLELLDDDLLHFEVSGLGPGPAESAPLFTTPQVAKNDYPGPSSFSRSGNTVDTAELRVVVASDTLCMTVTDTVRQKPLTTLCPADLAQPAQRLTLASGLMQNAYGLGEQFGTPGQADGDWVGRVRSPGDDFGNQMTGYSGGAAGNAQFPILYAVGPAGANYALFLDHIYKQTWNLTADPWKIETPGESVRGYLMTGADLPNLRADYMELVGRPLVPPRQAFGLWVSEYGYDSWSELEGKLTRLRAAKFPVDGFVLDLQWFGGVGPGSDNSSMGRVTWDTSRFPDAAGKLAKYRSEEGAGIITIEESYISKGLPEHADLQARGFLVRSCAGCPPVYLTANPWWGKGGMIDWTQAAAADYWHDLKRQPLIGDGVLGHWIDLGEPEQYSPDDWVSGILPGKHGHADYHNLYSFKWAESIARGYSRNAVKRRPFMLTRSGAPGIQRFGAAMWSADVSSRLDTLAAHLNTQMHMSMSGVDYFGSDVGGFHRGSIDGELNDVYTQWLADSLWVDVPVRPHTENLCNCKETAPDRIGSMASNLANVRRRYELIPYYYSLAHRAHLTGEPVVPPLAYYYQSDAVARRIGGEKLIGRDILVACSSVPGATTRDVYLPEGDWIDYHTGQWFHSRGQTYASRPLFIDGVFRVPAFARAGAILPKMFVDENTGNALGKRRDGSVRDELIARVYASAAKTSFDLFEDDGETIDYASGAVRTTPLAQQWTGPTATVTIGAASGTYMGASTRRNNGVELVAEGQRATAVSLNGAPLPPVASRSAFDAAPSGWFNAGDGMVLAKSGPQNVSTPKEFSFSLQPVPEVWAQFVCDEGTTVQGQAVYVVGNIPLLGSWQAQSGVKLEPKGPYPRWTGTIRGLPPGASIEWKCIKRLEAGDISTVIQWQPGANNTLSTPDSGSAGTTAGSFVPGGPARGVSARFVCNAGTVTPGQSVYVLGSIPLLGNWQAQSAVKLAPDGLYPRWTGTLGGLPSNARIEWKCIKRWEAGDTSTVLQWQPGANNVLSTPASGSAGTTTGSF